MISEGTRRFDLYDIFSVFLPGAVFLIGLSPFLPRQFDLSSLQLLLPLLVLGFAVGRAIHTIAVDVERVFGRLSHRDRFESELNSPELVTEETVRRFCEACIKTFQAVSEDDFEDGHPKSSNISDTIYVLVRSYVHMDSRGRSRTFQAVYSFHRSMWFVTLLLALLYVGYGIIDGLGYSQNALSFQTHLGSLNLPPGMVVLSGYLTALLARKAFSEARREYQAFFIQYLIADFLTLNSIYSPRDGPDETAEHDNNN